MLFSCLALLAEIEVFTDTALVPYADQWVAIASVAGNSIVGRLLFLLFGFLLGLFGFLAQLLCHHLGDLREHLLDALL